MKELRMPTPTKPPCWPDDPDYLDGFDEINLASSQLLKAYWDTDILDVNGVPPSTIIRSDQDFKVRFRVELQGDLWPCICGSWCFDVGFSSIGKGSNFNLSDDLPAGTFEVRDWRGCDTQCIELVVTVPAGTIPADRCSTVYELAATFELHCCDDHVAIVGYEALEEYQFYFEPA
jgi:hypothetical protein